MCERTSWKKYKNWYERIICVFELERWLLEVSILTRGGQRWPYWKLVADKAGAQTFHSDFSFGGLNRLNGGPWLRLALAALLIRLLLPRPVRSRFRGASSIVSSTAAAAGVIEAYGWGDCTEHYVNIIEDQKAARKVLGNIPPLQSGGSWAA